MSPLGSGGLRYGPPPPPPRIADLQHTVADPYNPSDPGLTLCFLDGSQANFPRIKSEDWDYDTTSIVITRGKVEHVYPLAQVAYMRWQAP